MKTLFAFIMLTIPAAALAHGTRSAYLNDGISAALELFEKEEKAVAKRLVGVKGWVDGSEIKVKAYLQDNIVVQYVCHEMHQENEMLFHCMKQKLD